MEQQFGYAKLDQPGVLQYLFHPRKEAGSNPPPGAIDHDIQVDGDISVGARFHLVEASGPNILFFHGNGEIVSDYDPIGPLYNERGLSLLAVDYRGYGRSEGTPTVTSMMRDVHVIFQVVKAWLEKEKRTGPLVVMGRSLGSACALELAASYGDEVSGLILDSGFALTVPLLRCLGVDTDNLGLTEADGFKNIQKIAQFSKPTLIIHAQHDQFIPVMSAEVLQVQCAARSKQFLVVPGADHNTILARSGHHYFKSVKQFTNKIEGKREKRISYREKREAKRRSP
jgi:pimeloyl-ACP methyl ester carboxylesterase